MINLAISLAAAFFATWYVYTATLNGQLLPVIVAVFVGGPVAFLGYKALNANKHNTVDHVGNWFRRKEEKQLEIDRAARYTEFLRQWYNQIGFLLALGDFEPKALAEATSVLGTAIKRGYNLDDDVIREWYFHWKTDPEISEWLEDYRLAN